MSSWRHTYQEPDTNILPFDMLCGMSISSTLILNLPRFLSYSPCKRSMNFPKSTVGA